MFHLLKTVTIINLFAALSVFVLSHYVAFFKATNLIDFLFFIVVVIWVFAKLMWEGGIHSKTTRLDDTKTDKVYSMVKGHDFDAEQQHHYRQNYQTGFVLFIAGLPAFITCLILQFM